MLQFLSLEVKYLSGNGCILILVLTGMNTKCYSAASLPFLSINASGDD